MAENDLKENRPVATTAAGSLLKSVDGRLWLLIGVLLGLAYLLSAILMPFMVAALLAYLASSLVGVLSRQRFFSRGLAVSTLFIAFFLLLTGGLLLVLPLLEQQLSLLLQKIPGIIFWLKTTALPWLQSHVSAFSDFDSDALQQLLQENVGSASSIIVGLLSSMGASGVSFINAMAMLVLMPVVTFYFLRDWEKILAVLRDCLPRASEANAVALTVEVDEVLTAFFKGQLLVVLGLALVYSIGLSLIGLEFALLVGLIAGLVSFVPYLGVIIGLLLGCVAAFFQLHDASLLVPVLLVFGLGQLLESFVFTPLLVGDKIGLHPVAVIFAVMAGGQLFGFTGVLLALPVAAVLMVFIKVYGRRYKESQLYLGNE